MKIFATALAVILQPSPAFSGVVVNLPCTTGWFNPDSYKSLIDGSHFQTYGGRAGDYLEPKYSKFLGFERKMSYQDSDMRYPQEYGYCKLALP
jgi:hypothetical protein